MKLSILLSRMALCHDLFCFETKLDRHGLRQTLRAVPVIDLEYPSYVQPVAQVNVQTTSPTSAR